MQHVHPLYKYLHLASPALQFGSPSHSSDF
jgi:hypothetical protein